MTFFLIALTAYFALDGEREHTFLDEDKSARILPLPLTTPRPPLTEGAVSSQHTQPSSPTANWDEEDPTRSGLGFPTAFGPGPACSRGREEGAGQGAAAWQRLPGTARPELRTGPPPGALTACRPGGSCRRSAGWIPSRSPAAAGSSPCLQGSAAPSARPRQPRALPGPRRAPPTATGRGHRRRAPRGAARPLPRSRSKVPPPRPIASPAAGPARPSPAASPRPLPLPPSAPSAFRRGGRRRFRRGGDGGGGAARGRLPPAGRRGRR